ncbi:MAG: hypothetical protein FWD16_00695 [Clostridia bacterium]|nr:hypothetical protein [Clostridia bacterium]
MLNAAPLLAGQDERLRWRMLNLAESLAGLVSIQRYFHGCRPLFPNPGHWDYATRFYRMIRDLDEDTPGIQEMIKAAETHNDVERFQRHFEQFKKTQT